MRRLIERWLGELPLGRRAIALLSSQGVPVYLVGGSVRDALLGRPGTDLDIAVEGGAMSVARRVADSIGGAYVPLDVERDVARVVMRVGGGRQHADLAGLRAPDIEGDLWARDYTVNAMAVRIGQWKLIDPTGGQRDLAARLLRVVSRGAFDDDPLRILRGVRLSGELGFALTEDTEALARERLPGLLRVSSERLRDEMVRMLSLPNGADTLAHAEALGVLALVLPEVGEDGALLGRGIGVLSRLEELLAWCPIGERVPGPAQREAKGPGGGESPLGPHRAALGRHWGEELSVGRPRGLALKLAALFSVAPNGAAVCREAMARLRFSRREMREASAAIDAAVQCLGWAGRGEPEPVAVYRYYRDYGGAGVDGAVLALAAGSEGPRAEPSHVGAELATVVCRLLRAWFDERDALVDPPRLLTGRELVEGLGLTPGPRVGELLELLREAQVQGMVSTRGQAVEFLQARVAGSQRDGTDRHSPGRSLGASTAEA